MRRKGEKNEQAIENLEAGIPAGEGDPPEGRGLRVPGRDAEAGGRYAQHLVAARMSELVFDVACASCDHWGAVGLRQR